MARKTNIKRNDPRINLAFYGEHLEFCREMAWKKHQSITAFVNELIAKEMEKHDRSEWQPSSNDAEN